MESIILIQYTLPREIRFQHEAYWGSSNQWSKTAIGIWDFGIQFAHALLSIYVMSIQAYVTQDDVITWTLTVREAVFYSAQLQLPSSMSLSKKKERAETTIKEMGLQDAMDTRIGGWGNKGLSGGQKRRVSICMEILTRPKLLFLDEPTSGLDSAASYYVMKRMIDLARQDRMTIIASIHQPSSQVFQLFHNLCLLSSGRTVYFGRSDRAYKFFESNGFPCPSHQNPSDHYLHTINTDFDEDMDRVFHANKTTEEAISFLARGSLLMFTASFLTIMTIGGFPSFVEDMKVFQRERLNGHYRSAAFVVSNTISSAPFLLTISLIPGAITYSLVGLQQGCAHFIFFASTLLACMMLVETLMLIVASIMPNFLMGLITGAGIQGLMILGGGFFRLPRDLPLVFWRYPLYYIAFHRYAYQGLFKNEFEGLTFPAAQVLQGGGGGAAYIKGEEILRNIWQVEMGYSKWMDLAMLFAMVAFYRLMLLIVLETVEKFKPVIREINFFFLGKQN
ncbi:hypothetical protein DKX38_026706 [Salix brachista]|uniref:ABC transporter domain-containing protein n=1 Tax=Salix brachista TaxID=2182728 RepID=A0A5N5JA63_9ROSI|nr:hypothetical protein DKX38_026706 [Salix brachista]